MSLDPNADSGTDQQEPRVQTPEMQISDEAPGEQSGLPPADLSRAQLAWAVIAFQLKLVADGLRDVLLSPLSIGAAVLGILEGGEQPGRYFRRVIDFGRRTERWINLFGGHADDTADELLKPLEARFHAEISGSKQASRDQRSEEDS